ncbi:MAG TPA: hypothetical protein VG387_07405 [Rhizomicrobium sp.]|jgi:hypothetical protein|nr:hypothetical protein [Rhizomicrobium sp.]
MSNPKPQDLFLVECLVRDPQSPLIPKALMGLRGQDAFAGGSLRAFQALSEPRLTVYLSGVPFSARDAVTAAAHKHLQSLASGEIEVSRLAGHKTVLGASHGTGTDYHLVVRTNVADGGWPELLRWYDEEHLGILASAPGTALAQRLVSEDAPPRSYACYDITAPEVLETRAWLSARETEWSSRVRPTFRDTRRVVSRRVALGGDA